MINTYDPKHYTLICELFNACNMNCEFCVKHVSKPDLSISKDYILNKLPYDLEKNILPELRHRKVSTLLFNLYGGELFMPYCIENNFLKYYETLVNKVRDKFSFIENIHVNFVSNGLFYGYENDIKQLLLRLNARLNISFDPVGRYKSDTQRDEVLKVIEKMKPFIDLITFTITKPNIDKIISEDIFSKFKDYQIDLSYYLPLNNNNERLMPSDENMERFYDYIIDNKYWNVGEIRNIIIGLKDPEIEIHSYCHRAMITSKVNNETIFNSCCYDMVKNFYEKGIDDYFNPKYLSMIKNPNIEDKRLVGRRVRGCDFCKYQKLCPSICHIAILWKGTKLSICPLSRAIFRLSNDKTILNEAWKTIRGDL